VFVISNLVEYFHARQGRLPVRVEHHKGLLASVRNIRLAWKWLTVKNTLANYIDMLNTAVKALFYSKGLGVDF
jgi:hypothetical protein